MGWRAAADLGQDEVELDEVAAGVGGVVWKTTRSPARALTSTSGPSRIGSSLPETACWLVVDARGYLGLAKATCDRVGCRGAMVALCRTPGSRPTRRLIELGRPLTVSCVRKRLLPVREKEGMCAIL
jgi:hypothetical protein